MPFTKIGELIDINPSNVQDVDSVIPIVDPKVLEDFRKFASNLKRIAPKADDFLYFSAVMMHAAEASLVNEDGTPKLTVKGELAKAHWDKAGGSYRWITNDPSIKPYKNSNGDIFPEEELVKAYKKWVGKPLCIDHKSSSVDHVRGIIVDTYYDRALKRVIALCALDKQNYPELAKKVATGVSNSVSMGTAVGRAICSDCATVAKTEADFCRCMKNRTCYGEINADLNPIELSIVVNGADSKAKIKHIIAAANSLNAYVERKELELKKLAEKRYNFSLNVDDVDSAGSSTHAVNFSSTDLDAFKQDVQKALEDLSKLKLEENSENLNADTNDSASNQSGSTVAMAETDTESTDFSLAPPVQRFAADELEDLTTKLATLKSSIEQKLAKMEQDLDKLANNIINTQEEIMSGSKDFNKNAYYLGTEEPTPGSPKYSKDPLNEKLRENGDKQMETQDTGSVDGLFPGDLEAKKMLARATSEERALRREGYAKAAKEALAKKKEAYFLGTEEPTPGKKQYPVDPMNEKLREDGDKHMEGQKPFPEVGKVDGLHPSPDSADQKDELKRKEMLARASLKARFVKASKADGSHDLGSSAWEVFLGDKLLLTASVNEISGGRPEALYTAVATESFGKDLIGKVKVQGADAVKSLFKKAQDAAPAFPAAPEAAPAPAAEPAAEDTGAEGDPKETAMELSEKVKDLSSDLNEAVRALTGEQAEMGDMDALPAAAEDGKVSTAALHSMRKELNGALLTACKEAVAGLNDIEGELNQVSSLYENNLVNNDNRDFIESVSSETFAQAKEAVANSFKLLGAFVKYARGTQAIVKRAAEEAAELNQAAHGDTMESSDKDSLLAMLNETNQEVESLDADLADSAETSEDSDDMLYSLLADDLADDNDAVQVPDAATAAEVTKSNPSAEVEVKKASLDLNSKAGRVAARAKLAAELKFNSMLQESHSVGLDQFPGGIDNKPQGDLAKVETKEETHKAVLDLANAPPKVRKEAAAIDKLVKEGKLNPSEDFPALIANGLDSDAVSYWKKYLSQADGGSEFASELVKEHAKAQAEEEMNSYKVKVARAYEIANQMVEGGLLARERSAVSAQVDEIMKWNDESIESFKRVIARHAPAAVKTAGRIPQVGLGSGEMTSAESDGDLYSQLSAAFSKSPKRSF